MDYLDRLFSLKDQVAIVLGGTGALAGTIAEGFARAGARIVVSGRNKERGEQRVAAIQAAGGTAIFLAAETTSWEDLTRVRAETLRRWGRIDILLNGAGGNDPHATVNSAHAFSQMTPEPWKNMLDKNFLGGVLYPCQIFGERMVAQKRGSIITIVSVSAALPLSKVPAYSAAKAAALNLTRFLAREWAPFGVRVNAISPGFFPSEQNKKLLYKSDDELTDRGRDILGHTPMRRFGNPQELVAAALWLASNAASSFVTGAEIRVDGGFTAMAI